MAIINENDVKSAFLPFLREFYRFRYEYNPITAKSSLNNVSSDGYIADGLLQFQKQNGSTFTCTFEASSKENLNEVTFSKNQSLFIWDCLISGLTITTLILSLLYTNKQSFIANLSIPGKTGVVLGIFLIGFFIWYFFAAKWKKYRIIYALEQFKRYYADNYWVALAEDVFPAPTNPYFLELKDQCIYNGIGLAIIYHDLQVKLITAPSNNSTLVKNRKMVTWITETNLFLSFSSTVKAAAAYQTPMSTPISKLKGAINHFLLNPLKKALGKNINQSSDLFEKFTKSYQTQKAISLLAIFIIGAILYSAENQKEILFSEKPSQIYQPEPTANQSPEQQGGFVLNETEKPITYGKSYSSGEKGLPKQEPQSINTSKNYTYTNQPNATQSDDNPTELCQQIKRMGGWYLQDSKFNAANPAFKRVEDLQRVGIKADAFNSTCLGEPGWTVRLDFNQYSDKIAKFMAEDYQRQIAALGLKANKVLVKKVPI